MLRLPSSGSHTTAKRPPGLSAVTPSLSSDAYTPTHPDAARHSSKMASAMTSARCCVSPVAFFAPPAAPSARPSPSMGAASSTAATRLAACASAASTLPRSSRSSPGARPSAASARRAAAGSHAGAASSCATPNRPLTIQSSGHSVSARAVSPGAIPHPSSALSARSASTGAGK